MQIQGVNWYFLRLDSQPDILHVDINAQISIVKYYLYSALFLEQADYALRLYENMTDA